MTPISEAAYFTFGLWCRSIPEGRWWEIRLPVFEWPVDGFWTRIGRGDGVHPTLGPFRSFHVVRNFICKPEFGNPTELDLHDPGVLGFQPIVTHDLGRSNGDAVCSRKDPLLVFKQRNRRMGLHFRGTCYDEHTTLRMRNMILIPVFIEWWRVGGVLNLKLTVTDRIPPIGPRDVPFVYPLNRALEGTIGLPSPSPLPPCLAEWTQLLG
jgi:hypothetical protein